MAVAAEARLLLRTVATLKADFKVKQNLRDFFSAHESLRF